jgi:probable phosphoglycerate mutase
MIQLYICRHGQSELNVEERHAGQIDTPLTDHGRDQAKLAGQGAGGLNVNRIVASPLSRALETAQIIARELQYPSDQILTNADAMERSYGSLQGQPWSIPADPALFPDMESDAAIMARAQALLQYLQGIPDETVLLVSHGGFLQTFAGLISGNEPKEELPNAVIVQLI